LRASSTSFQLRGDEEQEALVESFGRFLNGILDPIEVVVRSEPVELAARAEALEEVAATMVNPALQRAALGHARFLRELGGGEKGRRRKIPLAIVTRARERAQAQTAVERRAGEAIELLHAAGVELRILRGEQAAALLARTLDPPGPPAGSTLTEVVTRC